LALRVNLNLSLANPIRQKLFPFVPRCPFLPPHLIDSTIATTMTILSTLRGGAGGGESDDDWERRMDEKTDALMTLRGGGESDDDWERRMDEETDAVMKERKP
jgi:hypothetical protein